MSGKNPLIINIDIEAKGRKCEIIENSVASILFQMSDTTTRYVYKIHMRGMRNQSETTEGGLKNLELKKECDLPIKTRTETNQVFELSEKHRGNIMLVEFFKYEGVPVLCAACVLIVKPSKLRIAQVFFKDSTGKEVGCGSVQYEADLKFSLRVKYNRPLLRGEEAPKLKCKGYCTNATTGKYEEISKFSLDENAAYTDTIYCNDGLQESHAGADYVISLGFTDPYKPPFYLENTNKLAPSIQKIHLISRQVRERQIMSVMWSSKEMIKFGESTTQRKSIDRNEDGFLHIHTRGMYGQKVRVELYEKDSTGIKRLLLGLKNDVTILDNAVCVPIEMSGVYAKAKKGRFFLAEGFSFEIMAKVTPLDTSIAAFEQEDESIELMVYGEADEDKAAKSTVNGTMKFVIANVEEDEKEEENKTGKCPRCNNDITLDEIKKICVNTEGKCLITDDTMIKSALPFFNQYRKKVALTTCIGKAHFIAQICAETKLCQLQERFTYSSAERLLQLFPSYFKQYKTQKEREKKANELTNASRDESSQKKVANALYGATHPLGKNHTDKDDGWRYSGKGFKQITWKSNYISIEKYFNRYMKIDNEIDIKWTSKDNPYKLKNNAKDAIVSALAYWGWKGINSYAYENSSNCVKKVTARINASQDSTILQSRINYFKKAVEVLNVDNCVRRGEFKTSTFDGKYTAGANEVYINVIAPTSRDKEGPLVVFDASGILFKTHSLCRGSNNNRLKAGGNGDTPTGRATTLYDVTAHKNDKRYGNYGLIRLTGESGEFLTATNNGRMGIAIHAGHTKRNAPLSDEGKLMGTYGCIRVYNKEMKKLGELYSSLKEQGKTIYCYIEDYDGDIANVYSEYDFEIDTKDVSRGERYKIQ